MEVRKVVWLVHKIKLMIEGALWRGCHNAPHPYCLGKGAGGGNDANAVGNGGGHV